MPHPLAEVFGFPTDNLTADADRHRRDRLCPFGNTVPNCTKTSLENPLGVCSVHGAGGETVITCPVRFQEGWRIVSDAAEFFFPPGAAWTSLTKVHTRNSTDSSNIILLSHDALGRTIDYGLLRVQTAYAPSEINISGGRGRKAAVALDTCTYSTLPAFDEVDPADADLAFFVYALVQNPAQGRYVLTRNKTVYAKQNSDLTEASAGGAKLIRRLEKWLEVIPAR